jgi:hypothetical protein
MRQIPKKQRSLYNEEKATQLASFLLRLNNGSMDFLKCIKLLYAIEREAINRWLRPVIFDDLYSLPHGQVVSQTLDRAEHRLRAPKSTWNNYLTTDSNNTIHIKAGLGVEKLSLAEIELAKEIYDKNKSKTPEQLMNEHHNPRLTPEWKNPGNSRIKTQYSELLTYLNKTQDQIDEFEAELNELAALEALTR